jgi:hypothetical protein
MVLAPVARLALKGHQEPYHPGTSRDVARDKSPRSAKQLSVDDRRWLVSNKFPGALLSHPHREIAVVNLHDGSCHQNLCRHPSGHQRSAVDNQDAVRRMGDFEVCKK